LCESGHDFADAAVERERHNVLDYSRRSDLEIRQTLHGQEEYHVEVTRADLDNTLLVAVAPDVFLFRSGDGDEAVFRKFIEQPACCTGGA